MTTKPKGYPKTPELDKMIAITDQSQIIGEFLDWLLHDQGVQFMRWDSGEQQRPCTFHHPSRAEKTKEDLRLLKVELGGGTFVPSEGHPVTCECGGTGEVSEYHEGWEDVRPKQPGGIQGWLADYFEIDLNRVEQERSKVLDHVRANNG